MNEPRILILDDASDHRYLLAEALRECAPEYRVVTAGTADEALESLREAPCDAVLCDYRVDGVNGLEFLRTLRREGQDVPVLLITNHGNEEVARRAFLDGVADYLAKDAVLQNPQDLARKVRRAIERQRLTAEKHRAEAILESFLENNPYTILIFSPEGRAVRWNRALLRLETHQEDLARLRESYNPFSDPQLREAGVAPLLEKALWGQWVKIPPFAWDPSRAGLHGPQRLLRGVAFPIHVGGETKPHLCTMIQDVTDEEKARRERDEYDAILTRLLDATGAAIFFVTPDQKIRFANRQVERFFGVSPKRLIGGEASLAFREIASAAHLPDRFIERLQQLSGDAGQESEDRVDVAWPTPRHLRRHSGPVQDAGGRLLGRIDVYLDETEAVERSSLLEARNRELDAFASRLAHDLKTPLVSLKGFVDLLHRQYGQALDDRGALFLEKVRSSAAILGEMVDGLRELAHASDDVACSTTIDPLPILRLVADALAAEAAERGVEVILPPSCPDVLCDRARLFQLFQNLLSNAIRHCDPRKPARWVRIEVEDSPDEVALRVKDNGVGIEPEELPELFRPFRRGRQAAGKPGMGLGLAIVQRIVQVCRGRVEAVSEPGEGSTFTISLPRPG